MKHLSLIHERVHMAREGLNEKVICRVPSGWAVMGDVQFLKGYCLLLPDPVVPHLNAMSHQVREIFLRDMVLVGDAVLKMTQAVRINYEMLGNLEPALHAHIFPRFDHEAEELRTKPVWFYDWANAPKFDAKIHAEMQTNLRREIARAFSDAGISI